MKHLFCQIIIFVFISGVAYSQQKFTKDDKITGYKILTGKVSNQTENSRPAAPQDLPVTYIFTGNGNWNNPANWSGNVPPPQPTSNGSEIVINHITGGQCLLNIPYAVTPGTSLTVLSGKNLVLSANLIVN